MTEARPTETCVTRSSGARTDDPPGSDERRDRFVDRLEARIARRVPETLAALLHRMAGAPDDVPPRHFGVLSVQIENPLIEWLECQPRCLAEPLVHRFSIASHGDRLFRNGVEHLADGCRPVLDRSDDPLRDIVRMNVMQQLEPQIWQHQLIPPSYRREDVRIGVAEWIDRRPSRSDDVAGPEARRRKASEPRLPQQPRFDFRLVPPITVDGIGRV